MSAREGFSLPSGPVRFGLEAAFIVLVGVIAAVARLGPLLIVIVMGLAWVAVVGVEKVAGSTVARPRRRRGREELAVEPLEQVDEPAPPPTELQRRRIFSEPAAASPADSREWNLWELERRAREHAGADAVPEEWAAMFISLREFAKSDGALPPQFDALVRESFPELTRAG